MSRSTRAGLTLLAIWGGGLLFGGRSFALVGVSPVFLPDLLVAAAILLTRRTWLLSPLLRRRGWLVAAVAFLALMAVQSVVRGYNSGYPAALKSLSLGVYPAVAIFVAAVIAQQLGAFAWFVSRVLVWLPASYIVLYELGFAPAAASLGFATALAAAFAGAQAVPRHRWLLLSSLASAALLAATTDKRGPLLAVFASYVVARLLTPRSAAAERSGLTASVVIAFAAAASLVVMSTAVKTTEIPVVGGVAARTLDGIFADESESEASANVGIRRAMWSFALEATATEHPLIGLGAGRYVEIVFNGNDLRDDDTGVHNSFIGYAFYAGFPAALVAIALFVSALSRTASRARFDATAAALCGAVVGAVLICATNVALETPYLAAPIWATVAVALALPKGQGVPND